MSFGDEYVESIPFTLSREIPFDFEGYHVTADKVNGYFKIEEIKKEIAEVSGLQRIFGFVTAKIKWLLKTIYNLVL